MTIPRGQPRAGVGWAFEPEAVPHADDDPARLGEVLAELTSRRRWAARLEAAAVFPRWEEIVGSELARRCEPVKLAGGVLVVRAESPAWATQVSYLLGVIRQRADEVLGAGLVTTVRVVVGPVGGR